MLVMIKRKKKKMKQKDFGKVEIGKKNAWIPTVKKI